MYPIPCQDANISIINDRGNSILNKSMVEILPTQPHFRNQKHNDINMLLKCKSTFYKNQAFWIQESNNLTHPQHIKKNGMHN